MQQQDYIFQGGGTLSYAERDETELPLDFQPLGNVPACSIQFESQLSEVKDYRVRQMPVFKASSTSVDANISITLNDVDRRNLRLFFGGELLDISGGAVTNEPLKFNLNDDRWQDDGIESVMLVLAKTNIDTTVAPVVRYGPDGGPDTVLDASGYTINGYGELVLKQSALEAITDPTTATTWEIDYTYGAAEQFAAGRKGVGCTKRHWLRLSGFNQFECDSPRGEYQVVDIYNAVIQPSGSWDLISEEPTSLDLTGRVLQDNTRTTRSDQTFFKVRRFNNANI